MSKSSAILIDKYLQHRLGFYQNFIDCQKSFDSVKSHQVLWHLMLKLNIEEGLVQTSV